MELFLISFVVLLIALLGMGIGVLFGRSPIKGSCGGLNKLVGLGLQCDVCIEPCDEHKNLASSPSIRRSEPSPTLKEQPTSSPR